MNNTNTNSAKTESTYRNELVHRSVNAQGKLMAKVLSLREYWDCQLPDSSGICSRTRKLVLADLKMLRNPKSLKQVIRLMDQNFMTSVSWWPRKYREIIAKSFLAALDMDRIEALAYERLGLKAGPKAD